MAKKRKTRQQKIASTLRHNENPLTYSISSIEKSSVPKTNLKDPMLPAPSLKNDSYHFVHHDLIRTSTITGAIILVELALFFVLR